MATGVRIGTNVPVAADETDEDGDQDARVEAGASPRLWLSVNCTSRGLAGGGGSLGSLSYQVRSFAFALCLPLSTSPLGEQGGPRYNKESSDSAGYLIVCGVRLPSNPI